MAEHVDVPPSEVHEVLGRHVLTDGMKLVVDLQRSRGSRTRRRPQRRRAIWTCTPSSPRPRWASTRRASSTTRPSWPSWPRSRPTSRPTRTCTPPRTPSSWRPSSGCSATRPCPTCSSSRAGRSRWRTRSRSRSTGRAGTTRPPAATAELGTKILHLTKAFHGRSGYTLSLTNTEPNKTDRFPKFDWPRIDVPAITFPLDDHLDEVVAAEQHALDQARRAFAEHPHDIAAFIAEPIQGEGGDNHIRAGVLPGAAGDRARPRRAVHLRRGADRRRHHRHGLGLPAARACSPTSSPSPRRPRSAASWPAAGSTRCRTTCSRCPGGSTPPGAAISSTWSGPAGCWRSSSPTGLIEAAGPKGARLVAGLRADQRRDRPDQQRPRPRPVRRLRPADRRAAGRAWSPTCARPST